MEGDYVFAMKEKVRDIWNRKRLRCWTVNPSESPACNFLRNHTKHFRPFEWTQKLSAPRSIPFLISPPTIPTRLSVTNGIVSRADRDPAVGMVGLSRSHQPTCLGLARSRKESKLTFFFFFSWGRELSCHTSRKRVLITMWRALRRLQLVPGSWSESPAPFGMNILQFRLGPRALSKHS